MEGGMLQGTIEGLKKIGAEEAKLEIIKEIDMEIAKNLLKSGISTKVIEESIGLSTEEINYLLDTEN